MAVHWTIPAWLWPLLLVLAAGAALFTVRTYRRTRPEAGPGLRKLLTSLRTASLVLLVAAIGAPVVSRHLALTEPAEVLLVLEDSGSMALDASAGPDSSAASRWEKALALAAAVDSTLRSTGGPVRLVPVRGNGLEPAQPFGLDDPVIPAPGRYGTDLDALGRDALRSRMGHPVRASILISDGQETVAGPRSDPGTGGGALPGPSFVIGVGDPVGPADRAVADVRYPPSVHRGDEVTIELAVLDSPARDAPDTVLVRLRGPAGELAADRIIMQGEHAPAALTFIAEEVGPLVLEIEASPRVNERILTNNSASLVVNVLRDRSRVLVLSGKPGWDVRFLAQAGGGEARLDLDVVYPGPDGLILADSLKAWTPPATPAAWEAYQGVVLHRWSELAARGDLDLAALAGAVRLGLGLLVLPSALKGPGANPVVGATDSLLEAILPLGPGVRRWTSGEFFLARGDAAVGHPVLAGVSGTEGHLRESGAGGLQALPPLREVIVAEPGPEASVLLAAEDGRGGRHPLLVLGAEGAGRVAWFGGRELWELAFWERPGPAAGRDPLDHPGRRLLRNLLVWLATGEENGGLAFRGDPPLFEAGQPLRLEAGWRDMRGEPVRDGRISLVLRPRSPGADTTAVRTFRFGEPDPETGIAGVDVPPQPPGTYSVHLVGEGESPAQSRPRMLTIVNRSLESTQVKLDRRRLMQLASLQGARYVDADDSNAVAAMLETLARAEWRGEQRSLRSRYELWSGWPFLVAVVALLSVEWYLRRRHGLL